MEKKHKKEFKKLRNEIERKLGTIDKLRKKVNKENKNEIRKQIEEKSGELYTEYQVLEKQERQAVRRINLEERSQFCDFAACVKQVVVEEVAVMEEMESIKEVLESMDTIIDDPQNIPDTTDVMNDIMKSGTNYSFDTPTSSANGSLRGSRCGSLTSISSLVNSRSNSPLHISENNERRNEIRDSIISNTSVSPLIEITKIKTKLIFRACKTDCPAYLYIQR